MPTTPGSAGPKFKDAEQLLVAMRKNNATDLIVAAGARLSFKIHGTWVGVGNRDLTASEVRTMGGELLTDEQLKTAGDGGIVLLSWTVPGYGEFLVEVTIGPGNPQFSATRLAS